MRPVKKLCPDIVRTVLGAAVADSFAARFDLFRRVMHEHERPASEMASYPGRMAFSWVYSAEAWRRGGGKSFMDRVREAASRELSWIDYRAYDLGPLRSLTGDYGPLFCQMLKSEDIAEMECRMKGVEADLAAIAHMMAGLRRGVETPAEVRYRVDLYDDSFEAVIYGGKGGWLWKWMKHR